MRSFLLVITVALGYASFSAEAQDFPVPISPLEAKRGDTCAFAGRVTSVDPSNRTVVVSLGSKFLVHVPVTTPIAFRQGSSADFIAIKSGQMVEIVARRNSNEWIATKITLPARGLHLVNNAPGKPFLGGGFSVKTTAGKTITGLAAQQYVLYAPPEEVINRGIDLGKHSGLFLLSIRPDGTVAGVKVLQSLAVPELDERAIGRLTRMKFRPGSVTEARVPVGFFSFKTR